MTYKKYDNLKLNININKCRYKFGKSIHSNQLYCTSECYTSNYF